MSTISCNEFIDQLDLWMEGERDPQARAHVRDCSHCRSFADDLDVIQSSAAALTVADPEPPARIWNALRTQLVEEGLIHEGIAAAPVPRQPRVVRRRTRRRADGRCDRRKGRWPRYERDSSAAAAPAARRDDHARALGSVQAVARARIRPRRRPCCTFSIPSSIASQTLPLPASAP